MDLIVTLGDAGGAEETAAPSAAADEAVPATAGAADLMDGGGAASDATGGDGDVCTGGTRIGADWPGAKAGAVTVAAVVGGEGGEALFCAATSGVAIKGCDSEVAALLGFSEEGVGMVAG